MDDSARVPVGPIYGVLPGFVTDNKDPESQGRVKVKVPTIARSEGGAYEAWARVAMVDRGSWFIPDVQDEVLVAFMHGDPAQPCMLGRLWNGSDRPPEAVVGVLCSHNNVFTVIIRVIQLNRSSYSVFFIFKWFKGKTYSEYRGRSE